MNMFAGKTAIITGGAEGIGLSIAQALAGQGMRIVLGDINALQLEIAKAHLAARGCDALTVVMDVTRPEDWAALAEEALVRFGRIHMLVNNAGVGGATGSIEQVGQADWRWVMDVNLMGTVFGAQVIVPLIKQHGEGGWLLNVASMAGMLGVPYAGAYTASKLAVVGLSEAWHAELKRHAIQVSVLCPAFVKTRINLSERNRQPVYQSPPGARAAPNPNAAAAAAHMQKVIDQGLDVELVGARVVEALLAQELYIVTHPNYRALVQQRFAAIDAAFERAQTSPLLAHILNEEITGFS